MRQEGLSLTAIGSSALLAAPWALKFLWAPPIDRSPRRKPWILGTQLAAAMLMVVLAFLPADSFGVLLFSAVFLTNLVAATQDIATDGLAVDLLDADERGLGNGIQVAGYRVGMILGGGLLLALFSKIGWRGSFLIMAGLIALASLPLVLMEEKARERPKDDEFLFRSFIEQKGMLPWLAVLVLYKFGDYLAGGMVKPWMVDQKMTLEQIAVLMGTGGFTAGLFGALAGGLATRSMGRFRALIVFGTLQSLCMFSYGLLAQWQHTGGGLVLLCLAEHFIGGMATVALFTTMMDACRRESGATDYTVQASVVVFATLLASAMGGALADQLGYSLHFHLGGLVSMLGVAAVVVAPAPVVSGETVSDEILPADSET